MTLVLDTTFVLALMIPKDAHHELARTWFAAHEEDLVTSPLVVAELDHLVGGRGGSDARTALWANLDSGAIGVRWWADALRETLEIARRHPYAGLTDASLVALAGILRTNRIATFDHHFRSIAPVRGDHFVLLPQDA